MARRRTALMKEVEALGLPAPRIQFVWEKVKKPVDGMNWFCHYELVLRLGKDDIRNPHEHKNPGELVLRLGGTRVGSDKGPIWPDGTINTPYRDGAHALWDGEQLGNPPVYAIFGDKVMDVKAERAKIKIHEPDDYALTTKKAANGGN